MQIYPQCVLQTDRQMTDSCDGGTRVYYVMLWMRNVITHDE